MHAAAEILGTTPLLIIYFIVGACFGSFITLASYRLPRDESIVHPGSQCPKCHAGLRVADLFPIFSWVFSAGRCRHCKTPVSIRYPLIELLTGLTFCGIFLVFGPGWQSVIFCLFAAALMTMIVADLETTLIPDEVHYFLIPLGIAHHFMINTPLTDVLTSSALALFTGLLLHYGYYWLRGRHGLGFGDVKFLAVAGLWLGNSLYFVPFLFFSGMLGIATALLWKLISKEEHFPFGPALSLSLALIVLWPESTAYFWLMLGSLLRVN